MKRQRRSSRSSGCDASSVHTINAEHSDTTTADNKMDAYYHWERQSQQLERELAMSTNEMDRAKLTHRIQTCAEMKQSELARARTRLDARVEAERRKAELSQDRREIEGLLIQIQREAERERGLLRPVGLVMRTLFQ